MVTLARAERLTLPLAPVAAIGGGLVVALFILVMPTPLLEHLVAASGIASIIAAAEPPLGLTARVALGLMLGGGFAGFACLGLTVLAGERDLDVGRLGVLLRRNDVHPDAPPRPPLLATRDLGTPFLDVKAPVAPDHADDCAPDHADPIAFDPAEQSLPTDLDQPMAAFDPGALLAAPLPVSEAVAPLALPAPTPRPALIDPGDRFETFELTPIGRPAPLPRLQPEVSADDWFPLSTVEPGPDRHADSSVPEVATAAPVTEPMAEDDAHDPVDAVVAPETEATVHDLLSRLERGIAVRSATSLPKGAPADAAEEGPELELELEPGPDRGAEQSPARSDGGSLASALGDLRRMATGGC